MTAIARPLVPWWWQRLLWLRPRSPLSEYRLLRRPDQSVAGIYGPAIALDSAQNYPIGATNAGVLSARWRATTTSTLTGVIAFYRYSATDPNYSGGTNGVLRVGVKADDGAGKPTGAYLTYTDFDASVASPTYYYILVSFASPLAVTAGTLYHLVWSNVGASPTVNYISINTGVTLDTPAPTPRQPAYLDADYGAVYSRSDVSGGAFTEQPAETPYLDLIYANGSHDGMGYVDPARPDHVHITGTANMAREHFTVSGGNKTVTQVFVRPGRTTGTDVLSLRLETGAGTEIETVTIPAASVNVVPTPGADYVSTGNWVGATFAAPHVLANGQTYNLRLSCAATSEYSMSPILQRDFGDDGTHFLQSRHFSDGNSQRTTDSGGTWPDTYAYMPENMQFYFVTG